MNIKVAAFTVSEKSSNTLTESIQIYDLNNFKEIIVYVAGNDAAQNNRAGVMLRENLETEYIEEMYGKLISLIKEKTQLLTFTYAVSAHVVMQMLTM